MATGDLHVRNRKDLPLVVDGGGTSGRAVVVGSDGIAEQAAFAPASSTHDHAGVYQPLDSDLTTLAANITAAGHALVDDADNAAQRTTLGLGTIATQAASAVAITGGSVTGITDIAVADGGTGASTAAAARTNLGLSNTILHVANIAALKALSVSDIADETPYYVAGYYAQGDGGEGVFRYDAGSSATDNGGTIIQPTVGSGRWLRAVESGFYNVLHFGIKNDNTDAAGNNTKLATILSLCDTGGSYGGGIIYFPPGSYRYTTSIKLRANTTIRGLSNGRTFNTILRPDGCIAIDIDGSVTGSGGYAFMNTVENIMIWPQGAQVASYLHFKASYSNIVENVRVHEGHASGCTNAHLHYEGDYDNQFNNLIIYGPQPGGVGTLVKVVDGTATFAKIDLEAASIGFEWTGGMVTLYSPFIERCTFAIRLNSGMTFSKKKVFSCHGGAIYVQNDSIGVNVYENVNQASFFGTALDDTYGTAISSQYGDRKYLGVSFFGVPTGKKQTLTNNVDGHQMIGGADYSGYEAVDFYHSKTLDDNVSTDIFAIDGVGENILAGDIYAQAIVGGGLARIRVRLPFIITGEGTERLTLGTPEILYASDSANYEIANNNNTPNPLVTIVSSGNTLYVRGRFDWSGGLANGGSFPVYFRFKGFRTGPGPGFFVKTV